MNYTLKTAREGYEGDADYGKPVIEDSNGEWVATVDGITIESLGFEQVAAVVSKALDLDPASVTATPSSADIDIEADATTWTSNEWELAVQA